MNIFQRIGKSIQDMAGWFPSYGAGVFGIAGDWSRSPISKRRLLAEYQGLVYSCITTIAQDTARYEPYVYRPAQLVNGEPVKLKSHPLIELLENPNDEISQYELFEAIQTYMELTGEAFVYIVTGTITGRPKKIGGVLRPDRMSIAIEKGEIVGYVYRTAKGDDIPFEANEIVHFKAFSPIDQTRGYGPVEGGKLYIDIENETSLFQWGVLKNQAAPAGVLSIKGKIGKDAFQKLQTQWKEKYSGSNNAGKTVFVRASETEFTKVGLSLTDIQIPDLSKVNNEKIRTLFRMPREMLGDTSNSGLGRANIEAIEYVYAKRTIDPKYTRFDDVLTTLLRRYWGETDTRVGHVSHIPQDTAALLAENTAAVDKWKTRNEVRRPLGLPDIPGGDTLYVPFTNAPLEVVNEQPLPSDSTEQAKTVHKHSRSTEELMKMAKSTLYRTLDKLEAKNQVLMRRGLRSLLADQEQDVLAQVSRYASKTIKAIEKGVKYDGVHFELAFTDEDISLNLITWLLSAFIKSGETTLAYLGKPDAEFIMRQSQRDYVFNSTGRLMKSFNGDTTRLLEQQIAQGLEKGETVEQIKKRVEDVYSDAKGFRATRIADTEVHKAVNFANAEVYRDEGYAKLVWVPNADACEFCEAMRGETVDIGSPFIPEGHSVTGKDGGEYHNNYEDVKYADLHPHCKCRLEPIR